MTILSKLSDWAKLRPERPALVGHDAQGSELSLSYAQLWQRVQYTAKQLKQLNSHCIALRAENSVDWAVLDLAALASDINLLPIPTFFSQQQVTHALDCAGVDWLIGDWPEYGEPSRDLLCGFACVAYPNPRQAACLNGTCKVTFTSGSTGTPKGVCLSRLQLNTVTQSLADSLATEIEKHLVLLPLSTLLENITGVYVPITLGVTSYIYQGTQVGLIGSSQFDPTMFASMLHQVAPHSLVLTPALLMALVKIAEHNPALVTSLRFVAVGGASVAAQWIEHAHQLGIPVYEGYGLSECASVVCLNTPTQFKPGSCGKVLPHLELHIASDNEVWVKGNTALGYIDQPFNDEWYPTGDLADIDEHGFVTLWGRKKNQIITSFGRNISPEWIETTAQKWLLGTPIVVVGDAQSCLTAVICSDKDMTSPIAKLNQTLPDYARINRVIYSAKIAQLPNLYTTNGRPIRHQFEQWALTPPAFVTVKQLNAMEQNREEIHMTPFFEVLKQQTQTAQQHMLQAPIFQACQQGKVSRAMYCDFLTQAFHHVKHTVPLLMACGGKLSMNDEWLRAAIGEYISEEQGHHEWILNDLTACGANAQHVRDNRLEGRVSPEIELMVAYLYHQIDRGNPMALFGMVWVLEGTSVGVGGAMAELIQTHLGLGNDAMSYLTSHSVLDADHIQFFETLMNQITNPSDQQAIIDSANMVFSLYGQMLYGLTENSRELAA